MRFLRGLLVLAMSIWTAQAMEIYMDQKEENKGTCSGMYGRNTWGGPVDPFILVKFLNSTNHEVEDPVASLIIFEWKDQGLIGVPDPQIGENRIALCDDENIHKGLCNSTDVGKFVVAPDVEEKSSRLVLNKAVHLTSSGAFNYPIKKTGYYCILTEPFTAKEYKAVVEFRNAYGELPASQIPKLPFYGGITILYALLAVFWGFLYYQHRTDILAVQNYITAIILFLVVEMLMTWGFYDYENRHGSNIGSKVLMVIVGILNAGRNSFSFFLLLIVCLGYGVVKPTLGKTMVYVRALAAAHFVFGLIYSITAFMVKPESAGPYLLFVVLPLVGTLTAFYIWTLNALNFTLKDLRERRQHAKEAMYRKLWWAILLSVIVTFAFFFFNSFSFASVNDPDFVPFHWKTRWFVLDGWLNLVYFADVAWIAYVWRPTANNRRFAMSDEIAQDDDGNFEIGDIGVPDDSDDDEEAQIGKNSHQPQSNGITLGATSQAGTQQQQQASTRSIPRESLEGETIFAVADGFSDEDEDDESSDEENAKLVRGKGK